MTRAPEFDGKFLRVNRQTSLSREDGGELRVEGAWFDSQGAGRAIVARAGTDSLSTEWRNDPWRTYSVVTLTRAAATPH